MQVRAFVCVLPSFSSPVQLAGVNGRRREGGEEGVGGFSVLIDKLSKGPGGLNESLHSPM